MTNSGKFIINQYENHEELEKVMSTYHVPMITSCGSLSFMPDGSKTVEEIIKIVTADLRDFLTVTSLSQTTWHEWASVEVMEQIDNSDMAKTIYHMWRSPKVKPPHYRQLAMAVNSREFIKSAWKGYSHDNDKYGFDYAL